MYAIYAVHVSQTVCDVACEERKYDDGTLMPFRPDAPSYIMNVVILRCEASESWSLSLEASTVAKE
jgi:hypothetical protein